MNRVEKISVIIPTLNEEENIKKLLQFLENYKKEYNLEVIVTDGGSRDKTKEIASQYSDFLVESKPGRGIQLNNGARVATGDLILFLHADSILSPNAFQILSEAYARGVTAGCFILKFDNPAFIYRVIAFFSNLRVKLFKSCYGDQGIFVDRKLFSKVGGFKDIVLMEDLEFSQRLKKHTKIKVLKSKITTSSRRFEKKGVFCTITLMQFLKTAFHLGVDPEKLAKIYRSGS